MDSSRASNHHWIPSTKSAPYRSTPPEPLIDPSRFSREARSDASYFTPSGRSVKISSSDQKTVPGPLGLLGTVCC